MLQNCVGTLWRQLVRSHTLGQVRRKLTLASEEKTD